MKFFSLAFALAAAGIYAHRCMELVGAQNTVLPSLACVGIGAGFGILVLLVTRPENLKEPM